MSRVLLQSAYCGLLGVLLFIFVVVPFRSGHPGDNIQSEIDVEILPLFAAPNGYAVLQIRNNGSAPLYYRGYGKSNPFFQTRRTTDRGTWVTSNSSFCGVGISNYTLMAGQSQEIVLGLGPGEYRVGIEFRNGTGPIANSRMVWSDPTISTENRHLANR